MIVSCTEIIGLAAEQHALATPLPTFMSGDREIRKYFSDNPKPVRNAIRGFKNYREN
jgi:hypothetical protein